MPSGVYPRNEGAETLTRKAFGAPRGLSQGRVSTLVADGMPVAPDGRIDPVTADAWISEHLDPARRRAAKERQPAGHGRMASSADVRREKLEIEVAIAKSKLAEREGLLIERTAAEGFVFDESRKIRNELLGFVARSAPLLSGELGVEPQAMFAALDRHIRAFLVEMSSGASIEEEIGEEVETA